MEITKTPSQDIYENTGDMVDAMEGVLLKNPLYNSMTDDIQIIEGVYKNSNALGYSTLSQVLNYGDKGSLVPLMVENKDENEMISPIGENGILNVSYGLVNKSSLTSILNTHLRVSKGVTKYS